MDCPWLDGGDWIVTLTVLPNGIRTVEYTPPDRAVRPIIPMPHGPPSSATPGTPLCVLSPAALNRLSPASSRSVMETEGTASPST